MTTDTHDRVKTIWLVWVSTTNGPAPQKLLSQSNTAFIDAGIKTRLLAKNLVDKSHWFMSLRELAKLYPYKPASESSA